MWKFLVYAMLLQEKFMDNSDQLGNSDNLIRKSKHNQDFVFIE